MKEYLYETHLHTSPVSKCATVSVRQQLEFYKSLGYEGVFITNHFIDGNIGCDRSLSYEERINFYFSDYEKGLEIGKELGIAVFPGVESSYGGTDFLIYGLDKEWFLAHPEIEGMPRQLLLSTMAEEGALIIQAHPYREASYIECIRLFPRHVHGVEIYNSSCNDLCNDMAEAYAKAYQLVAIAGSDNHTGDRRTRLGGIKTKTPIASIEDFIERVKQGEVVPFKKELE